MFDYADLLRTDLPAPSAKWTGFPRYNFVGGHNDADSVPVEDLIAAATQVLKREGKTLATYGLQSGSLGYRPLREFIARNYQADERGCWYFQNGPQRVFVELAYAPLVLHYEGAGLFDHCARPFAPGQFFQDEEGSVLVSGEGTVALLDDRDLGRFADQAGTLPEIPRAELERRFGFIARPHP